MDEYSNVPKIFMGINIISKLNNLAHELAENKNIMLVTDNNIEKLGLIEQPTKSLKNTGFNIDIVSTAPHEPDIAEVHQTIEKARKGNYGLFIRIGGGSVMDITKIAAVMANTSGEVEDYLCPTDKPLGKSKPKIMVPTTSGTGSECSNFAVVIVKDESIGLIKTWMAGDSVMADAAIIDPNLITGLPKKQTACCGMDAMSHVAEAALSLQANPISDALALKAIELIANNLRRACKQGNDMIARWNMSLAATIGGIVISYPWIAGPALIGHVASEGISALHGMLHGETCGVLLPYVFWYNFSNEYARKKLIKIAEAMGADISGSNAKESSKKVVVKTFELLEDIGIPTSLKDFGISKKDITKLAQYILRRAEEMYSMSEYNPRSANIKNIAEFFNKAIEGRESLE